ncbi:MAG: FtsH protease activity modulator HflK [Pseudomonadota bacterium]
MPWNNQGGGWQGGGGQGPWGGRPGGNGGGGGGQQPPDLEELLRRSQEKVKKIFPGGGGSGGGGFNLGGGGSKKPLILIPLVLLGLWLASGIYRVQQEELGVVLRFGKYVEPPREPGLHWHWPSPIETVLTPKVTRINRVEVGFRSAGSTVGRSDAGRDISNESLMLTGDENIVDINFTVLWYIDRPQDYLFKIRDPEITVKAVAESAVREIIGKTQFAEATTEGREQIKIEAREQIQAILDSYGAGIAIQQVQVQKVDPPDEVIDAFRDVQRAQADRERAQNEAETYQNDILPRARGDAVKMEQEAEAYAQEVVARAEGDAQRFIAVYNEYAKAPDVTSRRLYLETMEEVLSNMNKVLIDGSAGDGGVVPYLPLPELERRANQRQGSTSGNGGVQ